MDLRPSLTDWLPLIAESADRTRVAAAAGQIDADHLTGLADLQAMFAHDLRPRPLAPLTYLEQACEDLVAQVRQFREHDPARIVHIRSEDGYDYAMTPRKALRREHDHVLDHLNQIGQWLAWQNEGIVPTPTDGWVPSGRMLADDTLELSEDELGAWLWRIEISCGLLLQRVAPLTSAQLDWQPPDGGWSLRQMLYHLGRGFYAHWLGQALPDEPAARYDEASRRFQARLRQLVAEPLAPGLGFVGRDGEAITPRERILAVLAAERRAHAEAA
jgi:DinB family protein